MPTPAAQSRINSLAARDRNLDVDGHLDKVLIAIADAEKRGELTADIRFFESQQALIVRLRERLATMGYQSDMLRSSLRPGLTLHIFW